MRLLVSLLAGPPEPSSLFTNFTKFSKSTKLAGISSLEIVELLVGLVLCDCVVDFVVAAVVVVVVVVLVVFVVVVLLVVVIFFFRSPVLVVSSTTLVTQWVSRHTSLVLVVVAGSLLVDVTSVVVVVVVVLTVLGDLSIFTSFNILTSTMWMTFSSDLVSMTFGTLRSVSLVVESSITGMGVESVVIVCRSSVASSTGLTVDTDLSSTTG